MNLFDIFCIWLTFNADAIHTYTDTHSNKLKMKTREIRTKLNEQTFSLNWNEQNQIKIFYNSKIIIFRSVWIDFIAYNVMKKQMIHILLIWSILLVSYNFITNVNVKRKYIYINQSICWFNLYVICSIIHFQSHHLNDPHIWKCKILVRLTNS